MPADGDPYARRLSLLETNLNGQATALKALLGAFETLSSSLAELTEELDDTDDTVLRVDAIEFRQQQLICVVRDMHEALGTLFRGLSAGTATFDEHSRELAELAEEASEALDDAAG